VVGGVVVDRIDGIGVDELLDGHHGRAFDLHAVQILVIQQEILVFSELIAFDQIAALELLSSFGILRDHADAVAGVRIDQMESEPGAVVARVQSYRRVQSWLDGLGSTPCGGPSALPDVSATAR
jgi:hypothetical protein